MAAAAAAADESTGLLPKADPILENVAKEREKPHIDAFVVEVAAELAEAVNSYGSGQYKLDLSPSAMAAVRIRSALHTPDQILVFFYALVFPLFERPLWCYFSSDCGRQPDIPTSSVPSMPYLASLLIDLGVLLLFSFMFSLRIVASGWLKTTRSPWKLAELILLALGLLDVLLLLTVRKEALLWIPYIRVLLFVVKNISVQSVYNQLIISAPQVFSILLLLATNIFLFGWLGVLIFWRTDCDPNESGNQGCSEAPEFGNLGEAWQNLYISLAFSNILDIIRDAKAAKGVWVIYVFLFVVSSIWILQSLVLAVIYNVYRKTGEERRKAKEEHIKAELKTAFKKLDKAGKGYLETKVIQQLFEAFNALHMTTHIARNQFELLCDLLDANNDNQVSEDEFLEVFDVLNMRFKRKRPPRKFFHDCLEDFYKSSPWQMFERTVKSNIFEYAVDGLVLATAVVIFVQTVYMLRNKGGIVFSDIDVVVTALFVVQIVLKLIAYGPHHFWEQYYFRFDLTVTVLMVVAEVVQHTSTSAKSRSIVRWVLVLRVLGIVRLLARLPPYRVLFRALLKLQKQLPSLALSFAVVFALFAAIGLQAFGGKITCLPQALRDSALEPCDSDDYHYISQLNFNDLYNAFCTLFAVMTSGDWINIVHNVLNRSSQWAQIYFYAFYIVANLAVLNLFVGFVIDSFLETFREEKEVEEDMSKWKARLHQSNIHEDQEIERIN